MYDPTMLTVAQAIQDDYRAEAMRAWQSREARATNAQATPPPMQATVARILVSLAARLAPPLPTTQPRSA